MPTITPTARAQIGGSPEEFRLPRAQVKAQTGMTIAEAPKAATQDPNAKTGQSGIKEDTQAQAVTLSPQLTALARKQQKLQAEIQAQRDKETEWAKKEADFIPRTSFKAKLQQDAAEALKDLGLNYEELTNLILTQSQGEDPVNDLRSEIEQLKADQKESVNKQYEATLKQYKAEAQALVSKDPKKYFLVTKEGAEDAIVEHIVETWQENPDDVLTVEEAADDIEGFLRDEAKRKKALLEEIEGEPAETVAKPEEKKLPPPRVTPTRTLSQQIESTPSRVHNQFQHLSMKERIAQAIARAQK